MKIAVAFENGNVCPHFGHAPLYRIFDVSEGSITGSTDHQSPGHAPGILPKWLSELEADVIIAGGMGPRAEELFVSFGIKPVTGISGTVEDAVRSFIDGTLTQGKSSCGHVTGEAGDHHH